MTVDLARLAGDPDAILHEEPPHPAEAARNGRSKAPVFEALTLVEFLNTAGDDPPPFLAWGIPKVGYVGIIGPPKVGKTVLTGQLALSVASGNVGTFLSEPCATGGVLYVAEEGSAQGIAWRFRHQMAGLGVSRAAIRVAYRQHVRLDDRASVARLRAEVQATKPALIVLDPLNRLHGRDENRPSDMTPVMDALGALAYDHRCAVVFVHHSTKPAGDGSRRRPGDLIRGAGAIRSATDGNLVLAPKGSDTSGLVQVYGEFRDRDVLDSHLQLDRETLLFGLADEPKRKGKLDEAEVVTYLEEQGRATVADLMGRFGIRSKATILDTLDTYEAVDWTAGPRGTRFYFLAGATVQ